MRFPSPPLQCIQHRATNSSSGQCTQLQCLYWGVFHCEGIEPRSRTTVSAVWSTISPPSPIPVSVAEWWGRRVGSGRRSYPGRRWRPPPATCPRHYHRGNRHFRFEAFVKAWSFSADSQVCILSLVLKVYRKVFLLQNRFYKLQLVKLLWRKLKL